MSDRRNLPRVTHRQLGEAITIKKNILKNKVWVSAHTELCTCDSTLDFLVLFPSNQLLANAQCQFAIRRSILNFLPACQIKCPVDPASAIHPVPNFIITRCLSRWSIVNLFLCPADQPATPQPHFILLGRLFDQRKIPVNQTTMVLSLNFTVVQIDLPVHPSSSFPLRVHQTLVKASTPATLRSAPAFIPTFINIPLHKSITPTFMNLTLN